MSSTVDSGLNLVETDSCPNFSRSAVDACSLDCLPSASWEMDSNANFSWNWSDSHKRQKEEKVKTKHETTCKKYSTTKAGYFLFLKISGIRQFHGNIRNF